MPSSTKRRKATNSMRNTLQRERSTKRTIAFAQQAEQAKEAARTRELVARETGHTQARVQTQRALTSERQGAQRKQAIQSAVVSTATPSSDSNLIMVTIFTMGGLILVYLIVTSSANFAGFLGGLQNWLHALSSNTPLFKAKT
jgi:Flp pilus assembly protein TadB